MGKVKIAIKSRWNDSVLFEYEKENNTVKETLEKCVEEGANLKGADLEGAYLEGAYLEGANLKVAYLEGAYLEEANLKGANLKGAYLKGANLKGANLKGANLKGANLKGAVLFYTDNDINNTKEIISGFIKDTNIKELSVYENHNQIPTRHNCIWKNVLIVNEWSLKDTEVKEMTVAEISEKLGYEVKIIK